MMPSKVSFVLVRFRSWMKFLKTAPMVFVWIGRPRVNGKGLRYPTCHPATNKQGVTKGKSLLKTTYVIFVILGSHDFIL